MSKKLTYGVAYNSRGRHKAKINSKQTLAYRTWHNMIARCYSQKYQSINPTYIDCSVTEDWLDFQNFADWFESHEYSRAGYQLDKDLLIPNNKVYSPDTCCFVPKQLNTLILDASTIRGDYPQGVSFHKASSKFSAQVKINNKYKHLGLFECPSEAHNVYRTEKEKHVRVKALEWKGKVSNAVFNALANWKLRS